MPPHLSASRVVKAELYVTGHCRGGCWYCFGQGDFGAAGEHVPIERLLGRAHLLSAFHRRNPLGVVPLLGGEPLAHPELPILAERFGDRLPLAVVSAGLPDAGADLDALIPHVRRWGATYNPHLADRFLALVNQLLVRGRRVLASMHFADFDSFRSVNQDFLDNALPRLRLPATWAAAFSRYVERWRPSTYYQASFSPFRAPLNPELSVCYSSIDARFTRGTPRRLDYPCCPTDRPYPCHLFSADKAISIAEDGRLLPCTSNAQRHATPLIDNVDRYGPGLPDDLAALLDRLAARLFEVRQERCCRLGCKDLGWSLDR